jgi:phosphatidylglycerophosphate synthase
MWSRLHAVCMLMSCGAGVAVRDARPMAAAAGASFLLCALGNRYAFRGRLAAPNAVTALRIGLVLSVPTLLRAAPNFAISAVCFLIFTLDGLDGWLARGLSAESEFGAQFDMEADAVFVLLIELELWQRDQAGVWVLGTGLLRYAYVLCLAIWPRAGPVPRFSLARYAFGILASGLGAAWLLPHPWSALLALGTSVPVGASFAYSFAWSYSRR